MLDLMKNVDAMMKKEDATLSLYLVDEQMQGVYEYDSTFDDLDN